MVEIVHTLTVIFIAASITLSIAKKLNQPAIPAYIIAGIISGYLIDQESLIEIAQLGIAFLVFIIGVKFDPGRLKSVARESQATALVQITSGAIIGLAIGQLLGLNNLNTFFIIVATSLSSTLIGLELLNKEIEKNLAHGRISESVHLIQDALAVIALLLITTDTITTSTIIENLAKGGLLLLCALIVRKYAFSSLIKHVRGSTELIMMASISLLSIFIAAANILEISNIFAAFLAGIAVAKFPYNIEILDTIGSLKDFFSAIFFIVIGSLIQAPSIKTINLTITLIIIATLIRPLITAFTLIKQGYDSRTSFLTGFSLTQISEFALIIAIQAFILETINQNVFNSIILATTTTMIISSYIIGKEHEIFNFIDKYDFTNTTKREMDPEININNKLDKHLIILGYDTQGKRLVELAKENNKDFVVIENDPEKIVELKDKNESYIFGNIMNEETWKTAKPEDAELIISTIPFKKVTEKIISYGHSEKMMVRASTIEEAKEYLKENLLYINLPDISASEELEMKLDKLLENPEKREEIRQKSFEEMKNYSEWREG